MAFSLPRITVPTLYVWVSACGWLCVFMFVCVLAYPNSSYCATAYMYVLPVGIILFLPFFLLLYETLAITVFSLIFFFFLASYILIGMPFGYGVFIYLLFWHFHAYTSCSLLFLSLLALICNDTLGQLRRATGERERGERWGEGGSDQRELTWWNSFLFFFFDILSFHTIHLIQPIGFWNLPNFFIFLTAPISVLFLSSFYRRCHILLSSWLISCE